MGLALLVAWVKLDHHAPPYRGGPIHAGPGPEDSDTVSLAKGFAYYTGLGRPQNMKVAFLHFSNAADKGSASAQYQVGIMLSRGEGARRDMEKALFWLRKAASQGHVDAQIALGTLYAEGEGGTPQDKAEAVNWLRALAGQGNTDAQAVLKELEKDMATDTLPEEELLAWAYASLEGRGVPLDKAEAARWFRKAAMKHNIDAQCQLAMLYDEGDGVPQDKAQAVKWYRKAAEQGLAKAQNSLGVMYENGDGVPEDKKQAVEWYRKAAEQGVAEAQNALGFMYDNGDAVPQDKAQAVEWYRKAAELGLDTAQFNLAVTLFLGDGVPQDKAQAAHWFRKAAEQGVAEAQGKLGFMYDEGDGVPRDEAQAAHWYRKAAEQGVAEAQGKLGFMLFEGRGVPKDLHEAVRWLRKAAHQGDEQARQALTKGDADLRQAYQENLKAEEAERYRPQREELMRQARAGEAEKQYELADAYEHGYLGLPVDGAQAVVWLRKAGEQNYLPALTSLAAIYSYGDIVPRDMAEAVKWRRKAGELGDDDSQEWLINAYHGRDIPRDMEQVIYWSRKLAEKREYEAYTHFSRIAQIYAEGDGVPQDKAQAAWYREAALMGDVDAPMRLARMYADGNGVPRDMDKAILWYHWAASTGSGEAMLELGRIYAEGDGVPQDTWMAAAWYCKAHDNEQYLKGRQAVKELGVDIYDIRMKGKVMNVLLGHRMEMAKCKLMHAYGEGWASGPGKARAAELRAGTARLAARILKELAALKEEKGDDLPPRIMQLADAVQAEARELQRMEDD